MKIAIINDTHFGIRNDSSFFLEHFLNFFEKNFFTYIKEHNIKTIFHLGDLLDRRKYINIHTLNQIKSRFIQPLVELGVTFHMILGNHDMYFRNTNHINSANELFGGYSNFNLHEMPYTFEHNGLCIGLIPWICSENKNKIVDYIKTCSCPILMGHFELNGYEIMSGVKFKDGMSDNILNRFESVLSGHFHIRSSKNNVQYVGTQYEMTFADVGSKKGFSVIDTETREVDFIENQESIFHVLNTKNISNEFDYSKLNNKYIKLVVDNKTPKKTVDSIVLKIEKESPFDFTVIEEFDLGEDIKETIDLSKDTVTVINEEIDSLTNNVDKFKLKSIMSEVYTEALNS
tara:strand:+ start:1279 stop:2313 length:1035 start_codon:yes stop_codon:yes gene_type:complete